MSARFAPSFAFNAQDRYIIGTDMSVAADTDPEIEELVDEVEVLARKFLLLKEIAADGKPAVAEAECIAELGEAFAEAIKTAEPGVFDLTARYYDGGSYPKGALVKIANQVQDVARHIRTVLPERKPGNPPKRAEQVFAIDLLRFCRNLSVADGFPALLDRTLRATGHPATIAPLVKFALKSIN